MPNNQKYLKISAFFKKKEGMTTEEFHKYWETVHANMCLNCKGFIVTARRYVQFHSLPEHKEMAKSMGVPALEWDGSSEIYVKSWEDWQRIYNGKDYQEMFGPDCANFMSEPIAVMIGYENVVYGPILPGIGSGEEVPMVPYEGAETSAASS